MRDCTLEDTIQLGFTTRFTTGVPTQLAGSPVLKALEGNNATPITAGVSVSVDRASVVGLNEATIVATAANGFEAGKSYSVYISTGTVGGVSVVGEVIGQFTIQASAAAVDLANGTDGLTALKAAAATAAALATVAGNVDDIETLLASTDTDAAAILALLDNARGEPGQGAPPVNPDLATKVDYLYKAWRNKKTNDGTDTKLFADDGATVDQKQATTESGGTVTKAEWVTGP